MTTHYIAQIDGVTVTRSTAGRTYTHVVVGYIDIAKARVECEKRARLDYAIRLRSLTKEAGGRTHYLDWSNSGKMLAMFTDDLSAEAKAAKIAERKAEYLADHAKQVAESQATLAADKGEEVWVADMLAAFDKRRAEATNKTTDGKFYVRDLGWSSRLDLAKKNAITHKTGHGCCRIEILDAVQVAKAAKPSKSKATR